MSIRDMTLFGAFTGGFIHYRGEFFYREGLKSPRRTAAPKAQNIFGVL